MFSAVDPLLKETSPVAPLVLKLTAPVMALALSKVIALFAVLVVKLPVPSAVKTPVSVIVPPVALADRLPAELIAPILTFPLVLVSVTLPVEL